MLMIKGAKVTVVISKKSELGNSAPPWEKAADTLCQIKCEWMWTKVKISVRNINFTCTSITTTLQQWD